MAEGVERVPEPVERIVGPLADRRWVRGVESSRRLGRHRWVIERPFAWFTGDRRW